MQGDPDLALEKSVQHYWDQFPCIPSGLSSDEATKLRYSREPMIPAFARFPEQLGKSVLEVGCGPGTDFIQFVLHGAHAIGVDLSLKSLQICKQRLNEKRLAGALAQCDAQMMPFPDETFDVVYSFGVLHHIPIPSEAVAEIHRVLKRKGRLLAMVYHKRSFSVCKNLIKHGLLQGRLSSTDSILAKCLESPGTRAFTTGQAKSLFSVFQDVKVRPVVTYYDTLHLATSLPRWLGYWDRFGWFMLITAEK